jgi:hypothetical protein
MYSHTYACICAYIYCSILDYEAINGEVWQLFNSSFTKNYLYEMFDFVVIYGFKSFYYYIGFDFRKLFFTSFFGYFMYGFFGSNYYIRSGSICHPLFLISFIEVHIFLLFLQFVIVAIGCYKM